MYQKNNSKILTIPNILSIFRILLIPVYVILYQNAQHTKDCLFAGGILVVSCLTDLADGYIARKCDMVSTLGIILDPIADKLTQITLVALLSKRYRILSSLLVLLLLKEGIQLVAGIYSLRKRKMLSGALPEGKAATAVLFTSLSVLVFFPNLSENALNILAAVNAGLLTISLVRYLLEYITGGAMIQDF